MALDMLRRKGYIVVRSRRSCSLVHLVAFRAGTSLLDHIGLVQELEDLLGCHVDVVTGNSVKERMRSRVLKDAIEV